MTPVAPPAGARGAPPGAAAFLPPEELLRLGPLDLVARLAVEGFMAGRHRSPGRGGALEFAQHRPYAAGDDLRRVDWKVYARTDRWYVRESEEETNLRATVVLDASASMGWSSPGRVSKWAYGRAVAAALSHLLLSQQDAVGLAVFADRLAEFVPPRAGRAQRARIFAALEAAEPGGTTAPESPFRQLAERLPRRGLLIVISDLLGPTERFLPGLRYFRGRKHEVVVLHLLDPAERSLARLGPAPAVTDAETGRVLKADLESLTAGYARALAELEATYRAQAHDRAFDFVPLTTNEPIGVALGRWLARRNRH